jgi:hypothetical protein
MQLLLEGCTVGWSIGLPSDRTSAARCFLPASPGTYVLSVVTAVRLLPVRMRPPTPHAMDSRQLPNRSRRARKLIATYEHLMLARAFLLYVAESHAA